MLWRDIDGGTPPTTTVPMKNIEHSTLWLAALPQVLQLSGIGLWELYITKTGVATCVSQCIQEICGCRDFPPDKLWSVFLEESCASDYKKTLQKAVANVSQYPGRFFHCEFPVWHKKINDWRLYFMSGQSLPEQTSGEICLLGCLRELPERKTASPHTVEKLQELMRDIERQKAIADQQIAEQARLLRDFQTRIGAILESTSPFFPPAFDAQSQATDGHDEVDVLFAEELNKTFDVITKKMSWYKAVLDSIPFPISVTDPENRWMYLNAPGLEAAGASSLRDVFAQQAQNWSGMGEDNTIPPSSHVAFTFHQQNSDRVYSGQSSNLFDGNGSIIGRIETMQDATEEHDANERTRLMFDAMPFGCSILDRNFNRIYCNAAAASLFEAPDKATFLEELYELSPEKQPCGDLSQDLAKKWLRRAFETGYARFEWTHRTLSGQSIPTEVSLVRINWRGDKVVVAYVADLRELKAARKKLDKERLLLKNILNSSPICMLILAEETVRFVTPFTRERLGAEVGDSIYDFHKDTAQAARIVDEVKRKKSLNWLPITIRAASGKIYEMLGNAFYTEYQDEESLVLWLMDVTEMRAKERELLQAKEAAEANTKAKNEFLANISHELRTPMNAVLGMAHLLARTELTPKQQDYLKKMEQSGKALLRVVNDVLDFSKMEAGKLEMTLTPFSVEAALRDVVSEYSQACKEKSVELSLSIPLDAPEEVIGYPEKLRQVLRNLVDNAVKFTDKGSVNVSATVVKTTSDYVEMEFNVADTGAGINQTAFGDLFSPFTQADTSTTRKHEGTGLGLAICKHLVEMMGGVIWCESVFGKGAVFRFAARFDVAKTARTHDAARFAELEALLLGDNSQEISDLQAMLRSMGCKVNVASSREQAAALLRGTSEVDVMLLSFHERRDDISKVLAFLQKKTRRILPAALVILPYASEHTLSMLDKNTASVLHRPVTPSSLFEKVNLLLAEKKQTYSNTTQSPDSENEAALARLAPFQGKRLLLVEDNPINQMVAKELLEIAGFVTDIANNGREAVNKVHESDYALVLMDIQMPEMDGLEATTEIRTKRSFSELPIIAMTALAMQGDREKSLAAGMNDHVTKPIDATQLYHALARWLS